MTSAYQKEKKNPRVPQDQLEGGRLRARLHQVASQEGAAGLRSQAGITGSLTPKPLHIAFKLYPNRI